MSFEIIYQGKQSYFSKFKEFRFYFSRPSTKSKRLEVIYSDTRWAILSWLCLSSTNYPSLRPAKWCISLYITFIIQIALVFIIQTSLFLINCVAIDMNPKYLPNRSYITYILFGIYLKQSYTYKQVTYIQ